MKVSLEGVATALSKSLEAVLTSAVDARTAPGSPKSMPTAKPATPSSSASFNACMVVFVCGMLSMTSAA